MSHLTCGGDCPASPPVRCRRQHCTALPAIVQVYKSIPSFTSPITATPATMHLLTLCLLSAALIGLATACSCIRSSHRDIFCANDFAAILHVRRKVDCLDWYNCYEVSVKRQFKPNLGIVREVITGNSTATCGNEFALDTEYLVIGQIMDTGATSFKAEVYSCHFPISWSILTYSERRRILAEVKPTEACKKKRKRVL